MHKTGAWQQGITVHVIALLYSKLFTQRIYLHQVKWRNGSALVFSTKGCRFESCSDCNILGYAGCVRRDVSCCSAGLRAHSQRYLEWPAATRAKSHERQSGYEISQRAGNIILLFSLHGFVINIMKLCQLEIIHNMASKPASQLITTFLQCSKIPTTHLCFLANVHHKYNSGFNVMINP